MPYSPVPKTTFGIELEFSSRTSAIYDNIEAWLANQSGICDRWKLSTDGSVSSYGSELKTIGGHSINDLLADYKIIAKYLHSLEKTKKISLDKTAGFHVHVGVMEWSVRDMKVFYESMTRSLDQWLSFQPRSRWDNHYCKKNQQTDPFKQVQRSDRYYMVNAESLTEWGTIELRLFAGTVCYYKVEKTLQLIHAFIRSVLTDKTVKPLLDAIDNKKLLKFVDARIKKCHKAGTRPYAVTSSLDIIAGKLNPTPATA